MKESFWGIFVIFMGVLSLTFIVLFQNITNTDQHNTYLLQEVTEAAMWDSVDYGEYRYSGKLKISREKFVENFIRRYAESASRSRDYEITFYDVNELPPKVSVSVKSKVTGNTINNSDSQITFDLQNRLDAILEEKY